MVRHGTMKTLSAITEDEQMTAVYRHDVHKMHGGSHGNSPDEWHGISVNQDVPYNADIDAAKMSRPKGKPEQTLHGHDTHYRRNLMSGESTYDKDGFAIDHVYEDLVALLEERPVVNTHSAWLQNDIVSGFNEAVYYPYTSLKYHTILVAALVWYYREGYEYDDLGLWVPEERQSGPHVVFNSRQWQLCIAPHERPHSAKLGSRPMQNFAEVWMRLPTHPWPDDPREEIKWIDAQLRRIQSWSTALQYLENALTEVGEI